MSVCDCGYAWSVCKRCDCAVKDKIIAEMKPVWHKNRMAIQPGEKSAFGLKLDNTTLDKP